jgi:hypothetical protein
MAKVGHVAPDFELDGSDGRFRLADHDGERASLSAPASRAP